MMTVSRQGVRLEQCQGCRGIFLDRGELEQIIDAEQRHYGFAPHHGGHQAGHYSDSPPPYRPGPAPYGGHPGGHYADSPPPYGRRRHRRSFLSELFD